MKWFAVVAMGPGSRCARPGHEVCDGSLLATGTTVESCNVGGRWMDQTRR